MYLAKSNVEVSLGCGRGILRRDRAAALHVKDIAVAERPQAVYDSLYAFTLVRRIGAVHFQKERGMPRERPCPPIQYVEFETLDIDLDQVRIFQTLLLIEHAYFDDFFFSPAGDPGIDAGPPRRQRIEGHGGLHGLRRQSVWPDNHISESVEPHVVVQAPTIPAVGL